MSFSMSKDEKEVEHVVKKKSILVTRTGQEQKGVYKRSGSSKSSIQWKPILKQLSEEENISIPTVSHYPSLGLLVTEDVRWKYIQEFAQKVRVETRGAIAEYEIPAISRKGAENLLRDFGVGVLMRRQGKAGYLTHEQEDQINKLKQEIKTDNDEYLKQHPELDILIQLIYRMLFNDQPDDPKGAVAKYVHYLNTHREEMFLTEVDVPFDRPQPKAESISSVDSERQKITLFAKRLVERCANIASHGKGYVDVTSIIQSMLRAVSPSEDSISVDNSLTSAEEEIEELLMSLLTSVVVAKTPSTHLVVDEILTSILNKVSPSFREDREVVLEARESIERFIHTLLEKLSGKAVIKAISREKLEKTLSERPDTQENGDTLTKEKIDHLGEGAKPILKGLPTEATSHVDEAEHPRVKFESVHQAEQ